MPLSGKAGARRRGCESAARTVEPGSLIRGLCARQRWWAPGLFRSEVC